MRLSATLAAILSAIDISAQADVAGTAKVIDGDTIVIDGEHVRLRGIDAPETDQTCSAYGQEWPCGRTAAEWLKDYLRGRQVDCVGHARDRYGRLLAVCYAGGESINDRLVREGWALVTGSTSRIQSFEKRNCVLLPSVIPMRRPSPAR